MGEIDRADPLMRAARLMLVAVSDGFRGTALRVPNPGQRRAIIHAAADLAAALSEATTSPEPLDWHARRKPDDPFPEPTRPEVEQMLRRRLDPMMVYALRPAGDPFADWAKAIIGEATTSPAAKRSDDHGPNDPWGGQS